jgi:hypothetical protein
MSSRGGIARGARWRTIGSVRSSSLREAVIKTVEA